MRWKYGSCRQVRCFLSAVALCCLVTGFVVMRPRTPLSGQEPPSVENAASAKPDAADRDRPKKAEGDWPFPVPKSEISHYTAYRVADPLKIDGRLDEAAWRAAPRSPRFGDMITGQRRVHETRSAVLWDEKRLYVAFWVEEPIVTARYVNRDSAIYRENDVELFIAGKNAYIELEVNANNAIYDVFFIWQDAYEKHDFRREPLFDPEKSHVPKFNGLAFSQHPRNPRRVSFAWNFPGLETAVFVDGTLNKNEDRDRGWTVELALPWQGMKWLVEGDNRSLPPKDGDIWRMDFSRFNAYEEAQVGDAKGWAWSRHGVRDSHIPEVFPFIHMSTRNVLTLDRAKRPHSKFAAHRQHNPNDRPVAFSGRD